MKNLLIFLSLFIAFQSMACESYVRDMQNIKDQVAVLQQDHGQLAVEHTQCMEEQKELEKEDIPEESENE